MARFINVQRRAALVVAAVVFTLLIRLISMAGHGIREDRKGFVVFDKGPFKQAVFRIRIPKSPTSYLFRIANFAPFLMLENAGFHAGVSPVAFHTGSGVLGDCTCECECNDCDCDCDCDCECGFE